MLLDDDDDECDDTKYLKQENDDNNLESDDALNRVNPGLHFPPILLKYQPTPT